MFRDARRRGRHRRPGPRPALMSPEATEVEAFRQAAREWLAARAPAKGSAGDFSTAHLSGASSRDAFAEHERTVISRVRSWQRELHAGGWAGLSIPRRWGGADRGNWAEEVFAAEASLYGVSTKALAVGLQMVTATLLEHGTDEQRDRYIAPILRADEVWCQLFSEPEAGSDLAGVEVEPPPTATGGSSPGRRSGPPAREAPTSASPSCAATRTSPATPA